MKSKATKGLELELQVQEILKNAGYTVIKKGKGVDILAYNFNSFLIIECKCWETNITGRTLTKIRRKLNSSANLILSHPLYSKLAQNKRVIKIIIVANNVTIRYGDILTFTLSDFEEFLKERR